MAKKSKARKRKQAQKRNQLTASNTAQPAKPASKPAKKPARQVAKAEEHKLDEMMNQTVPRQPLQQKGIIIALIVVVALMGIVLYVLYQKTNDLKQSSANTGQDQLLNVQESNQNSLQPTGPQGSSSNPQNTGNPQNTQDTNSAGQLQPQESPTPTQLNQMQ